MFLLGATGPMRRWLALHYCAVTNREMEYIALTRDTTESDLKQRKEIMKGGSSVYIDQTVVAAALHGRVLVIEGLEKAERNVLPVINNLLENREMALEDGRFLISPKRFETMKREGQLGSLTTADGTTTKLVPVHPGFRVVRISHPQKHRDERVWRCCFLACVLQIAIGVPVPPFPGNPLDPPLRSRFQARRIDPVDTATLLAAVRRAGQAPSVAQERLQTVLGFAESLRALGAQQAGADTNHPPCAAPSLCFGA